MNGISHESGPTVNEAYPAQFLSGGNQWFLGITQPGYDCYIAMEAMAPIEIDGLPGFT